MKVKRVKIWIFEIDVWRGELVELRKSDMELFSYVPNCDMKCKITIEMEEL